MGKQKQHNFTANIFLDASNSHIVNLDEIESVHKTSYHKMMVEIYQHVV